MESVGEIIGRLRRQKDWTQEVLAEKTGLPVSSIRNYEQDHRTPDLRAAYRLAKALGISVDVLAEAAGS